MSAAPSEPEKYSIDEMMDRLKSASSGNPEDGQLVIRADGTEAIRVRKRKRRSSQPIKAERIRSRRSLIIQVSAAVILVILAALGVGAAVIYANSPPFREGLVRKIGASTGAKVDLAMFRMNPKSANANTLTLTWPEGNVLNNLFVRSLNAEIFPSSFLGKTFNGEEISIGEGALALQIPKAGSPLRVESEPEGALPIQFKRYRIPKFNLTVGETSAPAIALLKSEASLSPNTLNGRPQFSLNQGELYVNGWPEMRLDRAFMEFRGKEIDVVGLRVLDKTDSRGMFEFSGTITPYAADKLSTLSVELQSFQLAGLTGPSLGRLISGRIDSLPTTKSNYLAFYPTAEPRAKLALSFRSALTSNLEVGGFPFLFALSQTLEDEWFQRPAFEGENASASLLREAGVVTLQDLKFESKGRLAIRGKIAMAANQALSGNLEIGVADAMITTAKASRLKTLFGPAKEGFRWMKIEIGGTAANPTDNFKDLFLAPAPEGAGKSEEPETQGSSFEELTKPR